MALGTRDNNRENRYAPTYYSAYSAFNTVSKVDPSRLSFSFWNRMLKVTITPMIQKQGDGAISWDRSNAISAYLTHTKAQILSREIKAFLKDPENNNSCGVISNETLITISNGKEFGTTGCFLVMRKIDKETGKTLSSYSYEFNMNFHSSVRYYDEGSATFELATDPYVYIEIEQFVALLDNYVLAMTGATAYAVVDAMVGERSFREISETIEACAKSLGVSTNRSQNGGGSNNTSVFNQRNNHNGGSTARGNSSIPYASAEEVEDSLFD